jgi:hypothetical protein
MRAGFIVRAWRAIKYSGWPLKLIVREAALTPWQTSES